MSAVASILVRSVVLMMLCGGGPAVLGCSRPAVVISVQDSGDEPAWIHVAGLTRPELESLRVAVWREEGWQALLQVAPAEGAAAPIPGRYVASREGLEFHPRAPLEPGRPYRVRFDPARLPVARHGSALEVTLSVRNRPELPRAQVTSISPADQTWPANLLRFYIHFSVPMSRTDGVALVRVLDNAGRPVTEAVAGTTIDFWNDTRTRYTGFLNSHGSRRGDQLTGGDALEPGREYTLEVDAAWRDAQGRPLLQPYRHRFRVGPAVREPLRPSEWTVSVPAAGSLGPLVVRFPRALDIGLLEESLAVARPGESPLGGQVTVSPDATEWRFAPSAAWPRGTYELLVLATLEDSAGNRVGQAAGASTPDDEPGLVEPFKLPFAVR